MARQFHTRPEPVNHERLKSALRRSLPRWYRRNRRNLPWRQTRDPYAIWVSEVMLQQTRVEVVRDYYHRWLREFPTVASLARARVARVLRMWEGLGYYRRARHLHQAARMLVKDRAGHLPTLHADWLELPGIGGYTAAAIASIAFDQRVPVVDGNVARVLARVLAMTDDVRQSRTQRVLAEQLQELMPYRSPGDFNQAMMELGALVCTPTGPQCSVCPLRRVCRSCADGLVDQLPNRGQPRPVRRVTVTAMAVRDGERILVRRRPLRGELAGLWELPPLDRRRYRPGRLVATIRHAIMDRRITLRVVTAEPAARSRAAAGEHHYRWVTHRQASRLAFAAGHRRALDELLPRSTQQKNRCLA